MAIYTKDQLLKQRANRVPELERVTWNMENAKRRGNQKRVEIWEHYVTYWSRSIAEIDQKLAELSN